VFNWREGRDIEGTLWVIQRHKLSASAKSELNKWRRIFFWNKDRLGGGWKRGCITAIERYGGQQAGRIISYLRVQKCMEMLSMEHIHPGHIAGGKASRLRHQQQQQHQER
jgi:hypothetical protein